MINKKIIVSTLSILASLTLMAGATYAFFTDSATSANNQLTTGTLNISVDQSANIFQNSTTISNWQPGEERLVRFDVVNQGSLPVNLRAIAVGDWAINELDENVVKVVKAEYWNGSAWTELTANANGLTGYVYYSQFGTDANLFELQANPEREQFRLTIKLDNSADNTYQGQIFNATVRVEARQTTAGATWPTVATPTVAP